MKRLISILLLVSFTVTLTSTTPSGGGRIPVYANNGMVVSSSSIASEVGRDILRQGGNAIDAAVATAFALAVTWPSAGNIGGGGFIVYVDSHGQARTFDFREVAPQAATESMYLDDAGNLIEGSNHKGLKSVGVPGTVAGLYKTHQALGKLPWKKVVNPAVKLASKGFPFTHELQRHSINLKPTWSSIPSTKAVMYKGDKEYEIGETWKQPELGKTLARIRDKGADGFYKGETAHKLVDFMKANDGLITLQDLASYQAIERKPVVGTYRGYTVYSMPPISSGGIALIEVLNILEGYDLKALGYKSADYIHVLAETMKRAYADRAEFLGDPAFNPNMPVDKLISKAHAEELRKTISMDIASVSDSSKFNHLFEGGDNTTHLSVVDKDGNAVSLTYTLEYSYGCQIVVEGLGFFLNNEMGDFNPVPGLTNSKGLVGTKPNLVAPGKRMLSSMTPTILTKDGKVAMVIGSPGGRTIINTVLQVILHVIDFDMNIAQAIEAPRLHHQWLPDRITYEYLSISPDTKEKLEARGHTLLESKPTTYQGVAMGIVVKDGVRMGAADSRGADSGAAGY